MKAIYWTLLVAGSLLFAACSKKETEDLSGVLEFKVEGADLIILNLGEPFNDPGVKVMYWGEDKSKDVKVDGEVDSNRVGMYELLYTFLNKDGLPTRASRRVIVADPSVTTDLSGKYTVQVGSQRTFNQGAPTPFAGFVVSVSRIAPGFFEVSDFFAGFYEQGRRLSAQYRMGGYWELKADNSLVLHSSHIPAWGNSLAALLGGKYVPETSELSYQADYRLKENQMVFDVKLKKNS